MTRLANPCTSFESHTEAACQRNDGDAAKRGVCAVPKPGTGELPLTIGERMLLAVGLNIANAVIAFVERPLTSRSRDKNGKAAGRDCFPDREWP